jgi:hypothetical protein
LWNSQPCFEHVGGALKFITPSLINALVGRGQAFTIVQLIRVRDHSASTSYHWSLARNDLGTRYIACRHTSSTKQRQEIICNTAGGAQPTVTSTSQFHGGAELHIVRFYGTGFSWRIDGVNESFQAVPAGLLFDANSLHVGAFGTSTPGIACDFLMRRMQVYAGALTDAECVSLESNWATDYGLTKAGLGATLSAGQKTIVLAIHGQSNAQGNASTLPFWAPVGSSIDMLALNGFRRVVSEPISDAADYSTGALTHTDPWTLGGWGARLADRLRERLGTDHKILIVPCALNSSSAAAWFSGISNSPQDMSTLYGSAWHRIKEALKAPNAVLHNIILQGEAEAASSLSDAQNWGTSWWGPILDQFNTDFAGQYWKTAHHTIIKIASNVSRTWVNQVRASQAALVAGRSDCLIYDPPGVTLAGLHFDTAECNTIGHDVADLIYLAA